MTEHATTYRGISVPEHFLTGPSVQWREGVDSALDTSNPPPTTSTRILQDPSGDLWYETSHGKFSYGEYFEDALQRSIEGESGYANWSEDEIRSYYGNAVIIGTAETSS